MVVFDESVWHTRPEDFELLQNGHLHLVRNAWALSRLVTDLTALGYDVCRAGVSSGADATGVRDAVIAAVEEWPEHCGRDAWAGFADGLVDHLTTARRPLVLLVLSGLDQVDDRACVLTLLDLLASTARWHLLFGRRLLCLVETEDAGLDLGVLGGEQVGWSRHEFLLAHRSGDRVPPWISGAFAGTPDRPPPR